MIEKPRYTGGGVCANFVHRSEIRAAIHDRTGAWVSERRIGAWITSGELPLVQVPRWACSRKWWTKAEYIDALIARHTFAPVPESGTLRLPKVVSGKKEFGFAARPDESFAPAMMQPIQYEENGRAGQ